MLIRQRIYEPHRYHGQSDVGAELTEPGAGYCDEKWIERHLKQIAHVPALQELRCRIPVADGIEERVALIRKDDCGGDPQRYCQAKNSKHDDALAPGGFRNHHRHSIARWNIGALSMGVAVSSGSPIYCVLSINE